ncbi:hypothetical protein C7S16_1876 [Burkholderia thailandensis]|uniref:Uncharacterized protein n=1 Tax=Burkholderia thailandensis TaxID=57975 RepID=A0AAW9CYP7_BURTH|nr:hypothetical protein [Burkholderia thailandensis]MDW9256013.1 hypothetical protein [Burkholderia thailandensis]
MRSISARHYLSARISDSTHWNQFQNKTGNRDADRAGRPLRSE